MAKTDKAIPARTRAAADEARAVVAVLAFDGCSAWITAGLIELFAIANVAISMLAQQGKASKIRRFDFHSIGAARRPIQGSHGVRFEVQPLRRRYDAVVVPPIWCVSREDLEQRALKLQSLSPLLRQLARRSNIMASACSGAVLLANAGLLANRRATTCWWLVDWFRQRFPDTELLPDRLVMTDGDRWTAAAGSAYIHLGLELVRELAGERASAMTARLMLVERRRGSQSPFVIADAIPRAGGDADIERALRYLDENAGTQITIAQACRALRLSERTLTRRFRQIVGTPPLAYLQSRRVARAKQLLEDTPATLEDIVGQCGYEDISSFRKLFTRHVGMTPREYRSRFAIVDPPNSRATPKENA